MRKGGKQFLPKATIDEIEELNCRIEDQQAKLSQITRKRELENARYDSSFVSPHIEILQREAVDLTKLSSKF
jgi:hypothetical protein